MLLEPSQRQGLQGSAKSPPESGRAVVGLWGVVAVARGADDDPLSARDGMPFNLGWWGFTFPLGVYAMATLALARQTHLEFLAGIGGALTILPGAVLDHRRRRTLHRAWLGRLFVSPCLMRGAIPSDLEADFV